VTVLTEHQGRRPERGPAPAGTGAPASIREGGRPHQGGGRFGPGAPRGGGRGGFQGGGRSGLGRYDRPNAGPQGGAAPRPVRPSKPAPPPPPLTKEALEGNVPLRTFGQLKQLWAARTGDEETSATSAESTSPSSQGSTPASPSQAETQAQGGAESTTQPTPGSE
jgi:hypothetical protein